MSNNRGVDEDSYRGSDSSNRYEKKHVPWKASVAVGRDIKVADGGC